jgi:putative hydrolase of the HAD superfamily
MTTIRAVLLDAHGTLVELEPPAPRLRRALRERLGIDVTEREASAALAAEITYYRRHLQEGRDRASVDALRERCAEVLFEALRSAREVRLRGRIDRGLMTATLLESLRFRPFDDAAPALSALRALGLRLVVASNWDASLPETLARVGILDALDGVVSSAACGAAKPAATLFEAALAVAGVASGEAIHVGDSVAEDVAGAGAAGIDPVFLLREDQAAPDGVVTIRTLAELAPLLAARVSADPKGAGAF